MVVYIFPKRAKLLDIPIKRKPLRKMVEINGSHSLIATNIVSQASLAGMTPAKLLEMIGIRFSSGSPSWQYTQNRLAYEIACESPKALQLVNSTEKNSQ